MAFLYDRPCVIVTGAARGGTTLLRDIVASHPGAAVLLEERLTDVVRAAERLASVRTREEEAQRHALFGQATSLLRPRSANDDDAFATLSALPGFRSRFEAFFRQVFALTCGRKNPVVVGSKLPLGPEWEDLGLLTSRLGDLRIVLIVRNPLDVIGSSLRRGQNARRGLDVWPIDTVEAALDDWIGAVQRMHGLLTSGVPILVVKYETLCASPAAECERLFSFLGLDGGVEAAAAIPVLAPDPVSGPRPGLTEPDAAFLQRELGPVDELWPALEPEAAIDLFARTPKYVAAEAYVSFAAPGSAAILASGFSFREPWGRWTDGPVAVIRLRHEVRPGRLVLDLPVTLAWGGAAPVELRANDGPPVQAIARGGEAIRLEVEAGAVRADGLLTLEITIANPKTPHEPPANDPRRLGVGFAGLRLVFEER